MPEVVEVITAVADIPRCQSTAAPSFMTTRFCADGEIRYVGPVRRGPLSVRDAARRAAAPGCGFRHHQRAAARAILRKAHELGQQCGMLPMHLERSTPRRRARAPWMPRRTVWRVPSMWAGRSSSHLKGQISHATPKEDGVVHIIAPTPASQRNGQHLVVHVGVASAQRACGMPAHGWRFRRQGVAVGAVRLRGGCGGNQVLQKTGQAAPGPRRRP